VISLVLIGAVLWRASGLQLSGVHWQQGLRVAHWRLLRDDCRWLQGEALWLRGLFPLQLQLGTLQVTPCAPGDDGPPAFFTLPSIPAFQLQIDALSVAELPPLQLNIRQQSGQWRVVVRHGNSEATAVLIRNTGQWQARARLTGSDWLDGLHGALALEGDGRWDSEQVCGTLHLQGHELGWRDSLQRAQLTADLWFTDRRWQLKAALDEALMLSEDWALSAENGIDLRGEWLQVRTATAGLLLAGPPGEIRLALDSETPALAKGRGTLALSGPDLAGTLALDWADARLTLHPGRLQLDEHIALQLDEAMQLALAPQGTAALPLSLHYTAPDASLALHAARSELHWGDGRWDWRGALALAGRVADYTMQGAWEGSLGPEGAGGKPAALNIAGPQLALAASLAVQNIRAPGWQTLFTLNGEVQGFPLHARLSAARDGQHWRGELRGESRMVVYSQGGAIQLALPWQWTDAGLAIAAGSSLRIEQGLLERKLIRPATLHAETPLTFDDSGLHGRLSLDAEGAVASRWVLPPLAGRFQLQGQHGSARLTIPDWQTRLDLSGRRTAAGASGDMKLSTPLTKAMSHGLDVSLKGGDLQARAEWRWGDGWAVDGKAQLAGLVLDWGGIVASGGGGELQFRFADTGAHLQSQGPFALDELNVGTPISDIRLQFRSNLTQWTFSAITADVLKGQVTAAELRWPSDKAQPVRLRGIDLGAMVALQTTAPISLDGQIAGELPLELGADYLAVHEGHLHNTSPIRLRVLPADSVSAMARSNTAVQLALDSLAILNISDLQATVSMDPEGWLDAVVNIQGDNPTKDLPVVFNYTHRENVLELLRSLRIGDELTQRLRDQARATDRP
jgi:hypothetical protein